MQFVEDVSWFAPLGIRYALGVDGISLFLVLLTTLLMPIAIYFSNLFVHDRIGPYLALMLLLETAMIGVFLALDLVLFFVFFEASLIPMYFLIGQWGGQNRVYAAVKFFVYTFAASALMVVAILLVYFSPAPSTSSRCKCTVAADDADVGLHRLCPGLCRQDAALPLPHLAARRPRAGAHRRLDHPGRRAAEDGHLRLSAPGHADLPGRRRSSAPSWRRWR
jgi:hypothetical protein